MQLAFFQHHFYPLTSGTKVSSQYITGSRITGGISIVSVIRWSQIALQSGFANLNNIIVGTFFFPHILTNT